MTDPEVPPPRRLAPWPGTLQLLRAIRDADAKALLAREAGVLQAIIQRQGKNGSPCVATMATLGADAKVDRRTVIRAIAGLKKRGLLHVQRQRGRHRGQRVPRRHALGAALAAPQRRARLRKSDAE